MIRRILEKLLRRIGVRVSTSEDENLFHILACEVLTAGIDAREIRLVRLTGRDRVPGRAEEWRRYVLAGAYQEILTLRTPSPVLRLAKSALPRPGWYFDCWRFLELPGDEEAIGIVRGVRASLDLERVAARHVLLVQRPEGNRFLFAHETGEELGDYLEPRLERQGIVLARADFSILPPREQLELVAGASCLVAAHGAALTNLAFAPERCLVVEVSFRTHWTCDPVCDAHLRGDLPIESACQPSDAAPVYHKADFHNLSRLLRRPYCEIPAARTEGYFDRNPINRRKVFVAGGRILDTIFRHLGATGGSPEGTAPPSPDPG